MSETYVIDIANADTVQNKIATVLNRAGSSPSNPVLRGLGTSLHVKLSPDVIDHEVWYGLDTPADDRILSLVEEDTNHYVLRGAIGIGEFAFDVDYTSAQRHFIRVEMSTASRLSATEREWWIQEDPQITCFLTSAQIAWCDQAAAQYYKITSPSHPCLFVGVDTIFNQDPGKPPTGTIQDGDFQNFTVQEADPTVAQVELGPDRVVSFGIYGTGEPTVPVDIPITLMDNWRDEFNIKHYGGAKYVSIFEDGLAEDAQGTLIQNQYQIDITTANSLKILVVDPDTEYVVTFRFRSEINDPYYVDKKVRFRVVTLDDLTRDVTVIPGFNEAPDVDFDAVTGEFRWADDTIFTAYGAFSVVEAWAYKGNEKVALPTDTSTAWSPDMLDHRQIIHGGLLTVQFRREALTHTEILYVTYEFQRPNGSYSLPVTVLKRFARKHSMVLGTTNYDPDTQFRLIRPTGGENVYLEVLATKSRHVSAVFWTDLGSISLDTPLKGGARYDVTSLFTYDAATGTIQQGVYNVLLLTDHQYQLWQNQPVTVRTFPYIRNPIVDTSGPSSDFVYPDVTVSGANVTIQFPELTDQGALYEIAGYGFDDPSDPSAQRTRIFLKGRKSIVGVDGLTPGGLATVPLSDFVYPEESTFEIIYSIDHDFADDVHYVIEKPTWAGYDAVVALEDSNDGPLQMIYWGTDAIFTEIPPNTIDVTITGGVGSLTWNLTEIVEDQPFDMEAGGAIVLGDPSVTLSYTIYNPTTDMIDSYGPYTINLFQSLISTPTTEGNLERTIWRPSRLVEFEGRLPRARIMQDQETLEFDYDDIPFSKYTRFKTVNPLDGTQLVFKNEPFNRTLFDIRRMFREDTKYKLEIGHRLLITFLHESGAHITAMYTITGEFEEPVVISDLRGQF